MKYKFTKLIYSSGKKESIDIDFKPIDFCCKEDEIYFIHENGLGKISDNVVNLEWHDELFYREPPDFSSLTSIAYDSIHNNLFLVSGGGSQIIKIGLDLLEYEELISKDSAERFRKKYLSKKDCETYLDSNGHTVVWSVTNCHRCFIMEKHLAKPLIGCGKAGFSISQLDTSRICSPKGIAISDNFICFNDSGNNKLRGIEKNKSFSVIDDCKDLTDLSFYRNKFFFLSGNSLHMLSSEGDVKHLFEIYSGKSKIYHFYPSGKNVIYILEDDNATTTEAKSD